MRADTPRAPVSGPPLVCSPACEWSGTPIGKASPCPASAPPGPAPGVYSLCNNLVAGRPDRKGDGSGSVFQRDALEWINATSDRV